MQVTHFAGNIVYNVKDFLDKNTVNYLLLITLNNVIIFSNMYRMNLYMSSREYCTVASYQFSKKCSLK